MEKKEENTLCFQQQGPGTVMPSGCHRPEGTFTRDRKICPALSHGFSPVPGAQGCSSLSCAQDQAPSPDTGAAPQPQQGCAHQARPSSHPGAGAWPWHRAVGAQSHHGSVNLAGLTAGLSPLGAPAACARPGGTAVQEPLSLGTKEGGSLPLGSFSQRQACPCSSPSLSCCPGLVSHGCCGSWHPHGHVGPMSQPAAEPMGTESPTAKLLCGTAIILYSLIPLCTGVWDFETQVTGFVPGFFSEYIYIKCYKN